MKKLLVHMILIVLIMTSSSAYANAESASEWAEEEVKWAKEFDLIHDGISMEYKNPIKRYEYVLLALKLLDIKNDQTMIRTRFPFGDINEHPYKDEIIRAYNAGIIQGYGDGTFRPEQSLSREELASLMTKLNRRLTQRNVEVKNDYNYGDAKDISPWAKSYIDYCYQQGIIKGTGKDVNELDIINPKGMVTVEQSILMIYRLAVDASLIRNDIGNVMVESVVDDEVVMVESSELDDVASVYNVELAIEIKDISEDKNVILKALSEDYISLEMNQQDVMTISHYGYDITFVLQLYTDDTSAVYKFSKLIEAYMGDVTIVRKINDDASQLIVDQTRASKPEFGSDVTYSSGKKSNGDITYYQFVFIKRIE